MGKGHIKPENKALYDYYRQHYQAADDLGGLLSNMGEYGLANSMWQAAAIIKKEKMLPLRVDLPNE